VAIPVATGAVTLLLLSATAGTASAVYSVALLCLLAASVYSYGGPFWAIPNHFLTGYSAAAGIALINSFGNIGGFAGPYVIGLVAIKTGSLYGGLAFVGVTMFISAALTFRLSIKEQRRLPSPAPAAMNDSMQTELS
jgi:nitrate/nitrite transporter NarK